jgi:hypothetical protein
VKNLPYKQPDQRKLSKQNNLHNEQLALQTARITTGLHSNNVHNKQLT